MSTSVMQSADLYRLIEGSYDTIYEQVRTALKAAGFEILAEINLAQSLAKDLPSSVQHYKIVVISNSDIAHQAITIAPEMGVSLPFHVGISQTQDNFIEVRIPDPSIIWNVESRHYLRPIAEEMSHRLEGALAALKR